MSANEDVGTPAIEREPPSLPSSPPHKRTKHIEPAYNLSVACECRDPQPTTTIDFTRFEPLQGEKAHEVVF